MIRFARVFVLALGACGLAGCQSPTSSSSTTTVDSFVDSTSSTAIATGDTEGRTYRVVRGNNQPDEVLPYQYVTTYGVTLTVNSNATKDDVNITFPVTVLSATTKVQQASGGIVTPPSGGELEHFDSVILSSSGSTISAVNGSITLTFKVWYSLPSQGKEAAITQTIAMRDNNSSPQSFSKVVQVNVAP